MNLERVFFHLVLGGLWGGAVIVIFVAGVIVFDPPRSEGLHVEVTGQMQSDTLRRSSLSTKNCGNFVVHDVVLERGEVVDVEVQQVGLEFTVSEGDMNSTARDELVHENIVVQDHPLRD